jgi:pimeloyl-ACP methyl ester carboxylesterase
MGVLMQNHIRKLIVILFLGSIIGVSWLLARSLHMQEELKPKPVNGITKNITVWIHGTRGSAILPTGISEHMSQVEKHLCSAPLGLHKAIAIDPLFNNYAIAQTLSDTDQEQFPLKHFYSFGWSGELDPQARKQAAQELYDQLKQLMLSYVVRYAAVPQVTLITHSHGGNVALNLASITNEKNPLNIEQLILLACPVQQETAPFADAPMFKKVYAIHSHNDQIQILDPQMFHPIKEGIKEAWNSQSLKPLADSAKESSSRPLFSERHFASPRVKHVVVNWKTPLWSEADLKAFGSLAETVKKWAQWSPEPRGLMHIEFLLHSFVVRLPEVIIFADECQNSPETNSDHEFTL